MKNKVLFKAMEKYLKFGDRKFKAKTRRLKDIQEVVFDGKWLENSSPNLEVYYIFRGLYRSKKDKATMEKNGLRYDITIISKGLFGSEYPKTMGHYHSFPKKSRFNYPEIYEVLGGKACFFFQKLKDNKITEISIVKAKKGDKVIVPPGFGHITINIGENDLKMANWMAEKAISDYKPIIKKGGAAYFALKNKKAIQWIKNNNYSRVPKIKFDKPSNYLLPKRNLYEFVDNLKDLEFLKYPQKFQKLWKSLKN